jgi:hypothetical protein
MSGTPTVKSIIGTYINGRNSTDDFLQLATNHGGTVFGWIDSDGKLQGTLANSVVASLNGLTGAITLAAGANITITPSGNTLTIASTGGTPGGSNTDVQINDSGVFYGDGNFTYNKNTLVVTCPTVVASGLITGQANIQLGVAGSLSGQITMEGSTSGSCTIASPATAGVITNPITISNSLQMPSGTVLSWNGDTGLSRNIAGGVFVGNGTPGNASGTITSTSFIIGGGQATYASTVLIYNGKSTVSNGIPSEVAQVEALTQTAAIGTSLLYAVGVTEAGPYRLSWNAKVITPAGSSSTLGALTITYTTQDGVVQTVTAQAQNSAGTSETTDTGNTTTTLMSGIPLFLDCKASTNIEYAFAYASNPAAVMAYDLRIRLEWL